MGGKHDHIWETMKKIQYKTKLSIVIICIACIPLTVVAAVYMLGLSRQAEQSIKTEYQLILDGGVEYMTEVRRINHEKLLAFGRDFRLQNYLKKPEDFDLMQKMDLFFSMNLIYQALMIDFTTDSLKIYSVNAQSSTPSFVFPYSELEEEMRLFLEDDTWRFENTATRYSGSEAERSRGGGTMDYFTFSRGIDDRLFYISRSTVSFSRIFQNFDTSTLPRGCVMAYLIDGERPIILLGEKEDQLLFAQEDDIPGYYVLTADIGYDSVPYRQGMHKPQEDRLALLVPISVFREKTTPVLLLYMTILFIMTAFVVGIVFVVSHLLTRRLYRLIHDINIDINRLGDESELQLLGGRDEFWQINEKFIALARQLKEYYNQSISYEYEKRMLESQLLQDLIAPHFLYNTLDGIRWSTDNPRLVEVIDSMVKYYRFVLNKGSSKISVSHEFSMIKEYLNIQRFAYESDFRYELEFDPELSEYMIPKNLIQPIVENTVIHGIDKREDRGRIVVSAHKSEGRIVFIVVDNGLGMSAEKLASLESGNSYGLSNIKKRIELYYGKAYGLTIESEEGKGTRVTITIPYQERRE